MYKYRVALGILAIIVLLLTSLLTLDTATAAITLNWITCDTCPEPPEVSISEDTIVLGITDRPEDSEQNRTIHGASALLSPADKYTISFDYDLFTWDSYNPTTAGWTGYWDSFSVSVSDRPYWELSLSDPVTPKDISGLGFIWGGTLWADGVLEHVSGTKTFTVQGNSSGTNYLNVILDTLTEPESNHLFPSWGTITITEVRTDVETTLPNQAANLAKAVVGAEYLWGGKGWDFANRILVEPQQVFQGYTYWNPKAKSTDFGRGLDCSGLVLWSYNKAFEATSMLGGPIKYEGADGQYRYNTVPVTESDLAPGDLLFFDWQQDGRMDHVARNGLAKKPGAEAASWTLAFGERSRDRSTRAGAFLGLTTQGNCTPGSMALTAISSWESMKPRRRQNAGWTAGPVANLAAKTWQTSLAVRACRSCSWTMTEKEQFTKPVSTTTGGMSGESLLVATSLIR